MKNLAVIGIVMLGLGFAIGWLAKPAPVPAAAPVAVARAVASTPAAPSASAPVVAELPPGKRAQRESAEKKPVVQPTEAQMEQGRKMQAEMAKAMVKRQREKFEKQIGKLTDNLHLTTDQSAGLTTWLEGRMKELEKFDFTDGKAMSGMMEPGNLLTTQALEDQLAASLTAEQKAALVDFKDREYRTKVDTAALKSLSKLQGVIEFEEGQRDKVYEILVSAAEQRVLEETEKPDVAAMFTEGMGIEMDPYDLGLQQAMTEVMGDSSKLQQGSDSKQMGKNLRQVIDQRIDARVEQLRPVLDEKQLGQYRAELKAKGMGLYGPMLMGLESDQAD